MMSSVRNMVNGIFRSFIISTNLGSFSAPSSNVTKTILSLVGMSLTTGTSPGFAFTGFSAGGAGGAANGLSPHLRYAASTPAVSAPGDAAAVPLPCADGAEADGVLPDPPPDEQPATIRSP